ncbi:hypothetical protein ACFQ16_08160 [Saccharopolyspora rosea]|uniref:Uncharacterized protein n=1 Tax=Saccharopolyspora rosea TaxID=524884 RepID=A0ABW3FQ40_9PSEU
MSWNDFHQRQHAIQSVLDAARRDPSGAPATTPPPFTDRTELLRALHYKWTQLLTGRIGIALVETEDSPLDDRVQAVTTAWRRTAAENPVLRAVLDHHDTDPDLRECREREHRLLALAAGLAEPGESDADRVGAAFVRLLRATPDASGPAPAACQVNRLRSLIPSF